MKKFLYFIPAVFYYSLIFFMSSKNYRFEFPMPIFDKCIHFFEFAILGILLSLGFFKVVKSTIKVKTVATFITGAIFAISDEMHQYFVPGRQSDILDTAADIGGLIFGIFLFWCFFRILKPKIFGDDLRKEI